MPTVPFLLLASICFGRSSPRLNAWLLNHPRYGPPIKAWREHGAIARKAKVYSIVAMSASFVLGLFLLPVYAVLGQGIVLAAVALFILTRPDH